MQLEIKLDSAPISLNQTERSTRGGIRYKSPKFQKWKEEVNPQLLKYRSELVDFAKAFDPYKHIITAEYIFGMPNMYCKGGERKGLMNLRAGDTDNFIKPICDLIFDKLESNNPLINDVYVVNVIARKVCTHESSMTIRYDLVC